MESLYTGFNFLCPLRFFFSRVYYNCRRGQNTFYWPQNPSNLLGWSLSSAGGRLPLLSVPPTAFSPRGRDLHTLPSDDLM